MSAGLIKDGFTHIHYPKIGKRKQFLLHWRNGRRDGFPICCILRFSLESAWRDGKTYNLRSYFQRPAIGDGEDEKTFIPCHIFHRKG